MPRANDFCIWNPHHEGAEVFGSQKQKPDIPIRADKEIHRPDTINFFWPHPMKKVTWARAATLPTIVEEVKTSVEQVQPSPPARTDVHYITAVLEFREMRGLGTLLVSQRPLPKHVGLKWP